MSQLFSQGHQPWQDLVFFVMTLGNTKVDQKQKKGFKKMRKEKPRRTIETKVTGQKLQEQWLSGEKILCGKKAPKNQVGVSQVCLSTNLSGSNFLWQK